MNLVKTRKLLVLIICFAFVSIGFAGSLLGVAWPGIEAEFDLPVHYGGYLSTVRTVSVVISCYLIGQLFARFGIGKVTALSVIFMTAGWLGFASAPSFEWMLLAAVPLGLGGGALDSACNNLVSVHYKPQTMSWLHTAFGIGAVVAPLIMSGFIEQPNGWRTAYYIVAAIQFLTIIVLFTSIKKIELVAAQPAPTTNLTVDDFRAANADLHPIKMKGLVWSAITFFVYSSIEVCCSMWFSTYLIHTLGISEALGSQAVALFFVGLTVSRVINGFLSGRFKSHSLIRFHIGLLVAGSVLLMITRHVYAAIACISLIGFGHGPLFATLLSLSPQRFGSKGKVNPIGFQLSVSFIGAATTPVLVGTLFKPLGYSVLPIIIIVLCIIFLLANERCNAVLSPLMKKANFTDTEK